MIETEDIPMKFNLDGKIHVFIFTGTAKENVKFAMIEDLSETHPHDQLDACIYELKK
jgi:hypothetical protein